MQRIVITAVLVAGFAGSALAETPFAVPEAPFVSSRTVAEVQAERNDYKRTGTPWAIGFDQLRNFRSTTTREAVTAGYLASRDQVHAMTGEDSGSQWLHATGQRAPAAPVLASQ